MMLSELFCSQLLVQDLVFYTLACDFHYNRLLVTELVYQSDSEGIKRDSQQICSTVKVSLYPHFTTLCLSGKNRHLRAPKSLVSVSLLQPLQARVRNRISTEQNAQERA